jgi:GT2 family glycosyltransferase
VVFKTTGLLDDTFFMYGEDVDWAMRVRRGGWELWYCPAARVWHKENAAGGYKSPFVEYWSTRSNLKLVRRYYPWRLPVAVFFHVLRAGRRVFTGKLRRAAAVSKGIASGVAGKLAI